MSIVTETRFIDYGSSVDTFNLTCTEHLKYSLKKRNWGYVSGSGDPKIKLPNPEFTKYWVFNKNINSLTNARKIDTEYHDKIIRCFIAQDYLSSDWVHPKQFKISVQNIPFFEYRLVFFLKMARNWKGLLKVP